MESLKSFIENKHSMMTDKTSSSNAFISRLSTTNFSFMKAY